MWTKFQRRTERFISLSHGFGVLAIFFLLLLILADITSRLILHTFEGTIEYAELLMAVIAFMSLGYTQIQGTHVRVDTLVRNIRPRLKAVLDICILLLLGFFVVILTWQHALELHRAWTMKLIHPSSGSMLMLILWPSYVFAVTGLIVLLIAYTVQITQKIEILRNKHGVLKIEKTEIIGPEV
ncbi:TRAP transporter small permease subunit [Chloroflexota bacterium]